MTTNLNLPIQQKVDSEQAAEVSLHTDVHLTGACFLFWNKVKCSSNREVAYLAGNACCKNVSQFVGVNLSFGFSNEWVSTSVSGYFH